jgi:hypothetical protein
LLEVSLRESGDLLIVIYSSANSILPTSNSG